MKKKKRSYLLIRILTLIILDLDTGRLSRNVIMTGNILLNGKKRRADDYGAVVSIMCRFLILHIVDFDSKTGGCSVIFLFI
jgi:hypothetical protein